jgi:hypothetical protein
LNFCRMARWFRFTQEKKGTRNYHRQRE